MIIYQDQMTKFKFSTKTKFPKTLNRQKSSLKLHKLTQIIPVEDLQNLHIHPDHEETFMMLCTQFWVVFFQDLIDQKMIASIILEEKKHWNATLRGRFFVSFYPEIDHLNCLSSCDEEPDRFTKPAKHFQRLNWVTTSHGAVKMFVSHLVKVLLWWLLWILWLSS